MEHRYAEYLARETIFQHNTRLQSLYIHGLQSGSAAQAGHKDTGALQGSAVSTKQMPWSEDCAERCDIVLAADILYDPGKPICSQLAGHLPQCQGLLLLLQLLFECHKSCHACALEGGAYSAGHIYSFR